MTTQVITKNAGHWPDRIFEPHTVDSRRGQVSDKLPRLMTWPVPHRSVAGRSVAEHRQVARGTAHPLLGSPGGQSHIDQETVIRPGPIWHCVCMPEQGSGDATQQPAPPPPSAPPTMTPVEPQKIEIIPLEPKKIIKRSDKPLSVEKRDSGGSEH